MQVVVLIEIHQKMKYMEGMCCFWSTLLKNGCMFEVRYEVYLSWCCISEQGDVIISPCLRVGRLFWVGEPCCNAWRDSRHESVTNTLPVGSIGVMSGLREGVSRTWVWVYMCVVCSRMCQRMYQKVNECATTLRQVPLSVLSPIAAKGIIRVSCSVHPYTPHRSTFKRVCKRVC